MDERLRVLVEVQKARFTDEVMPFREYLGRHYADRGYDEVEDGRRRHRPLRAIYILGECLPRTTATVLLASRRRTDLERLLSVFDQGLRVPGDRHVLEVNEREIPERYAPALRRLSSVSRSWNAAWRNPVAREPSIDYRVGPRSRHLPHLTAPS